MPWTILDVNQLEPKQLQGLIGSANAALRLFRIKTSPEPNSRPIVEPETDPIYLPFQLIFEVQYRQLFIQARDQWHLHVL